VFLFCLSLLNTRVRLSLSRDSPWMCAVAFNATTYSLQFGAIGPIVSTADFDKTSKEDVHDMLHHIRSVNYVTIWNRDRDAAECFDSRGL
jgi:hypothetical protein